MPLEKKKRITSTAWMWTFQVGVVLSIFGAWTYAYRSSSELITFTVDRRKRVTKGSGDSLNSKYLVWSHEGEVFEVTDSWAFLIWNSSDRYGQLREGETVIAEVAGWRVPFLSWYRNVVKIQSVNK